VALPYSFKALEFATWQRGAEAYDRLFGAVTADAIVPTLEALQVRPGQCLLDIGCGTGQTVAAALERGVVASGIDLAPAMVALAQRRYPAGRFRVGDAEALEEDSGVFDAACSLFAINHVPDQELAIAEAFRILRPGGLFAFTMWRPPGPSVFHALVRDAIAAHGQGAISSPVPAPRLRFGEKEPCTELLISAGFERPQIVELPLAFRLDSPHTVLELADTSPRVSSLLAQQSEADRRRIQAAIVEGALAFRCGDLIHLPIPALLTVGRKPT
jgi:SAM-dependent methyltransferase